MAKNSQITLSERDVMKGWYILANSNLQDAVRENNSAPTRAGAAFEAGYFSALQVLGPHAAGNYAHPAVQLFEDARMKLDFPQGVMKLPAQRRGSLIPNKNRWRCADGCKEK